MKLARSTSLLALVGEIAALAARTPRVGEAIPRALQVLRDALGAGECMLWRPNAAGLPAVWRAGDESGSSAVSVLDLEGEGAGMVAVTVRYDQRDLGVLSLRLGRGATDEERTALRAVADTLAPLLAVEAEPAADPTAEERVRHAGRGIVQKIVDSLPLGLYVIDREYRIQAWNRKRETGMQGVAREEAMGRTVFEILHRQSAATLRAEFDEVFSTGRIVQNEVESLAGGEQRTYRMSKIPMRLDDGVVTHVITIGEDITESRRAQERLAQVEKLAAVGQLAAGVMHEINNPLATIGVCADNISRRIDALAPPEESRKALDEYVGLVWHEVERCRRIVDQLLDLSRPRPLVRTAANVHEILETTLHLLNHHSRFRRVTLVREFSECPEPSVRANTDALVQAFMALLLNAADAMNGVGRITVATEVRQQAREVVVQIADEGSGIARADLPRLFEPFFTTKEPGRGTGLGLSICYGIIGDHGGRIEVESAIGEGSIFRVVLPMEASA
jgi:two-component system, NtrC family, sensor kinase